MERGKVTNPHANPTTKGDLTYFQVQRATLQKAQTDPLIFAYQPPVGPNCQPSAGRRPSDFLRLEVQLEKANQAVIACRLEVRAAGGQSADTIISQDFLLSEGVPSLLCEIKGFVAPEHWEVYLWSVDQNTQVQAKFNLFACTNYCCFSRESIFIGEAASGDPIFDATADVLVPGGGDPCCPEEIALLESIRDRQTNETQKTQLVGAESSGGVSGTEAAGIVATGGNNDLATQHSLAAANPLEVGDFGFVSSNAPGSYAVPSDRRVQRILVVGNPAGDPVVTFSGVAVGGFNAQRAPLRLLVEIDVKGRCSLGGTVLVLGALWWGVETTKDP